LKNSLLRLNTAVDIDLQVEKILRGLGSPKPPLSLEDVRELLRLDQKYYSIKDDSAIREFASRIYVAGKQILKNPMLLVEAIRKADLKALYIPDLRRILIDSDQPKLKHRWSTAHEIGHSVIPWHKATMLGDDKFTLSEVCREHTESEANYAAGRLLFFRNQFTEESNDVAPTLNNIKTLQKSYGNTITSTLWRYVEGSERTLFGAVSEHPRRTSMHFDSANPLKYFIRSAAFINRFSCISEIEVWNHLLSYCTAARGGPLGTAEVVMCDDNGDPHLFVLETFSNSHEALTIGTFVRSLSKTVVLIS